MVIKERNLNINQNCSVIINNEIKKLVNTIYCIYYYQ